MIKALLLIAGTLSLIIGIIGIVVPGLPTTTFLLITAACYVRSSEKAYDWLLNHKIFGKYIHTFRTHKAMTVQSKVVALVSMWTMITISSLFVVENYTVKIIIISCGIVGTIVILLVRTMKA